MREVFHVQQAQLGSARALSDSTKKSLWGILTTGCAWQRKGLSDSSRVLPLLRAELRPGGTAKTRDGCPPSHICVCQ